MKAEELMIGDWVDFYHPYEPEKKIVTRHRVTETYECGLVGISNYNNPVHADHLEPIKITTEKLEKNGFENDSEIEEVWVCKAGWLTPHNYDKKFYPSSWEVEILGSPNSFHGVIDYIHELQHAINSCKINKQIQL